MRRAAVGRRGRAWTSSRQSDGARRSEEPSAAEAGADVRGMRGSIHRGQLGELEREAPRSMAFFSQALRLSDHRPAHDRRRSSRATSTSCSSRSGSRSAETANRVRGRIETIIAKNVDIDDKDFRNPAELTKQLREKLPKRSKRVVQHHPALPYIEAPQFMATGWRCRDAAAMLRFLIFTACRTNEVVGARLV